MLKVSDSTSYKLDSQDQVQPFAPGVPDGHGRNDGVRIYPGVLSKRSLALQQPYMDLLKSPFKKGELKIEPFTVPSFCGILCSSPETKSSRENE